MDISNMIKEALLHQCKKDGQDLIWMGFYSVEKIPRVFIVNRWFDARVLAYELFVGNIPVGYKPKPTCGNWGCIDPGHLSLVLERETKSSKEVTKTRPRAASVKSSNGTKIGVSNKLTPEERQEIIDTFFGTPENERTGLQSNLAHKFDVTPSMVSQLLKAHKERENPLVAVVEVEEDAE